jgi:hypothetical protein
MNSSSWSLTSPLPRRAVDRLNLVERPPGEVQALPLHVVEMRRPADWCLLTPNTAMYAIDDPLEHAHIFAVARPQKLAVGILRNQFTWKTRGVMLSFRCIFKPVTKVVAHVVSAEWQHGHRIATDRAHLASGGSRRLRTHCGADVNAGGPVSTHRIKCLSVVGGWIVCFMRLYLVERSCGAVECVHKATPMPNSRFDVCIIRSLKCRDKLR